MRQFLFTLFFLMISFLLSCFSYAGMKETSEITKIQKETDTIKKSSKIQNDEITENPLEDLIYNLADIEAARLRDSLWLKEVFNSDLFEEMVHSIAEQEFEKVDYDELSTEVLKQRLEDLNARTPFRIEYNPTLENVIKYYLKNRRNSITRIMGLSEYYFPMFEEILDRHGLPLELKYLAIVESALNPTAKSRMGATGLWQFMLPTGKMYGLNVTSYVDERSDPILSTDAASRYLKSLKNSFDDWDLALAAYNCGPGNVSKAIRRSGGSTDYWTLRNFLPRETAGYVPAFIATMYIFEYAAEHGFTRKSERIPYLATDTIRVKQQITLDQVAKLTSLDKQELEFLNPSYKVGIIPAVEGRDYVLRLPITTLGAFVNNEEAIYDYVKTEMEEIKESLPEHYTEPDKIRYKVKNGDVLGKIAGRYGVSVKQIQQWNGLRNTHLKVGQNLILYPRKNVNTVVSKSTETATASKGNQSERVYTVKAGDSLWSISQKFPGVSVENIQKWNGISGTSLKPGTKLKIYPG